MLTERRASIRFCLFRATQFLYNSIIVDKEIYLVLLAGVVVLVVFMLFARRLWHYIKRHSLGNKVGEHRTQADSSPFSPQELVHHLPKHHKVTFFRPNDVFEEQLREHPHEKLQSHGVLMRHTSNSSNE